LVKPFWVFGIDRTVQNMVGSTEYGMLFALFNMSVIFNIMLDLGITNFNNRYISQKPGSFSSFFPNIVAVKSLLTILYALVVLGSALFIGYDNRQMVLLILLIVNQIIISFTLYLRSNLSGLQYYTTDSILSVSDRVIMIIACLIAYYTHFRHHLFTIEEFLLLQTFAYILSAIIVLGVLLSKTGCVKINFHWAISWKLIKAGMPYALLIFLMAAYSRIDSVMLERLLVQGKEQAGIYAQSFRILDSVVMMPLLFAGLLLPMLSKMLGNKENIAPLVRMTIHLIWIIAVAFSVASAFYAKPIIHLLYAEGSNYSATIFSILIFSFIPISVVFIFGTLITASGKLQRLNLVSLASVCINIGLNLLLIPRFMALGAAISCLITQFFVAVAQCFLIRKQFSTLFANYKKIAYFTLLSAVVAYGIHAIVPHWIAGFLLIGICIPASGFILGLIPFTSLSEIKRYISS
jgi:O-antigen/teichoic acid export membrane protein